MTGSDDINATDGDVTLSELREQSERIRARNQEEVLVIEQLLEEISHLEESRRKEEVDAEACALERERLEKQAQELHAEIGVYRQDEFEDLKKRRLELEVERKQLQERKEKKSRQAKRKRQRAYRPNPPRTKALRKRCDK